MNVKKFNLSSFDYEKLKRAMLIIISAYTVLMIELVIFVSMRAVIDTLFYLVIFVAIPLLPTFFLIYYHARVQSKRMFDYMNEIIYSS